MAHVILFVCQGATAAARRGAFPVGEAPMCDKGLAAAGTLAVALAWADRALCGPHLASVETARAMGMEAVVDPALRDLDYGRWAGRLARDIQEDDPATFAAWMADPAVVSPPGGETTVQLLERTDAWLATQLGVSGRSIAMAPSAFIRAAVVQTLGADPRVFAALDVAPFSRTQITSDGLRWRLRTFGELPPASEASRDRAAEARV